MKICSLALAAAVVLLSACASGPTSGGPVLQVKFVAQDQYSYDGTVYSYADLLKQLRAAHGSAIEADMDDAATIGDIMSVCTLQSDTSMPVRGHYLSNGEQKAVTCQQ
ncbi:MAG TPA: hypothetical protein VHP13_00470 [Gammaproteobacteria bacterium]|jgi:hypothetical protein|nr:hypothetical protein [Gammaproteobacteria bacterium]